MSHLITSKETNIFKYDHHMMTNARTCNNDCAIHTPQPIWAWGRCEMRIFGLTCLRCVHLGWVTSFSSPLSLWVSSRVSVDWVTPLLFDEGCSSGMRCCHVNENVSRWCCLSEVAWNRQTMSEQQWCHGNMLRYGDWWDMFQMVMIRSVGSTRERNVDNWFDWEHTLLRLRLCLLAHCHSRSFL